MKPEIDDLLAAVADVLAAREAYLADEYVLYPEQLLDLIRDRLAPAKAAVEAVQKERAA